MLLECLLAMSIFSITVVGLVIAIHRTTDLYTHVQRENWVQKNLKNVFYEFINTAHILSEFQNGDSGDLGEFGAQYVINVTPADIENTNGEKLPDMYDIELIIYWFEDDQKLSSSLKTLHYYPLSNG